MKYLTVAEVVANTQYSRDTIIRRTREYMVTGKGLKGSQPMGPGTPYRYLQQDVDAFMQNP